MAVRVRSITDDFLVPMHLLTHSQVNWSEVRSMTVRHVWRGARVGAMLACIAACSKSPGDGVAGPPPKSVRRVAAITLTGPPVMTGPGSLRLSLSITDSAGREFDTTVAT